MLHSALLSCINFCRLLTSWKVQCLRNLFMQRVLTPGSLSALLARWTFLERLPTFGSLLGWRSTPMRMSCATLTAPQTFCKARPTPSVSQSASWGWSLLGTSLCICCRGSWYVCGRCLFVFALRRRKEEEKQKKMGHRQARTGMATKQSCVVVMPFGAAT